jgi:hypothetical protein
METLKVLELINKTVSRNAEPAVEVILTRSITISEKRSIVTEDSSLAIHPWHVVALR